MLQRQAWYNKGATVVAGVRRLSSSKTSLPPDRLSSDDRALPLSAPAAETISPLVGYKSCESMTDPELPDSSQQDFNSNDINTSLSMAANIDNGANIILDEIADFSANESSRTQDNNCGLVNSCYMEIDDDSNSHTQSGGATPTRDEFSEDWRVIDNDTGLEQETENGADKVTSTSADDGDVFVDSGVESISTATTVIDEVGVCDIPSVTVPEGIVKTGASATGSSSNAPTHGDRSMSDISRGSSGERRSRRYGSVESNHSNTTLSSDKSNHSSRHRSPPSSKLTGRTKDVFDGREPTRKPLSYSRRRFQNRSRSRSRDRKRRRSPSPESSRKRGSRLRSTYPDGSAYPSGSSSKSSYSSTSSRYSNSKSDKSSKSRRSKDMMSRKGRSSSAERLKRTSSPTGSRKTTAKGGSPCSSEHSRVSASTDKTSSVSPHRRISSFIDRNAISDGDNHTESVDDQLEDSVCESLHLLRKESETQLDKSQSTGRTNSESSTNGRSLECADKLSGLRNHSSKSMARASAVDSRNRAELNSCISVSSRKVSDRPSSPHKPISKKSYSKGSTSHYSRAKLVYNARSKASLSALSISDKTEKDVAKRLNQAKILDGVGIQKIRVTHQKAFLKQFVEDNYMEPDGKMAKGMKPLMAFKIGNPQFVSEFLEKKTEMMNTKSVGVISLELKC